MAMSWPFCRRWPVAELRAWLTHERIGAESVLPLVAAPEHGAALVFLGTVRDHNEGRAVSGVHYEGYAEMAARTLSQILDEVAARVQPCKLAAVHRLGELGIGDVSIAIAVSTPHRAEAFEACRNVIEEVKRRLTVWKQERYMEGDREWLAGVTPPSAREGARDA
jgi:molybdopterin synthase catalytic subunit